MCYDDENKLEKCLSAASIKKKYVAPQACVIPIEPLTLLADSRPGTRSSDVRSSVDDIKYGGDLYEEDMDDQ